MMKCGSERWIRTEKRWLFCTWCCSIRCAEDSRGATDSVLCRVWYNDKFSQFWVFWNCGSSAKCNKPKGWSMTLSRKRKLFFGFSCSLISWKKPRASLFKNILLLQVYHLFFSSFFDSCLFCGRNDTDIGRGSSVASSRLILFLVILLHFFSIFLLFLGQCFSFFFFIAFFEPFCTSSFLSLFCFICSLFF